MMRLHRFAWATALAVATAFAAHGESALTAGGGGQDINVAPQSATCNYPFGAGNLLWCVSTAGNLTRFISPAGAQIMPGTQPAGFENNEGYVLCTPTGARYGLGWTESGWGAPVLVSLTATSVQISRTTSDGHYTLVQKWSRDTNERDLTIQMKLTNNGAAEANVYLARFANIGVNGDSADDRYDATIDSLWAREIHGVTASPRLGIAHTSWIGNMALNSTCTAISVDAVPGGPGSPINPTVWFANRFNIGNVNAGQSKTVYLTYRAQ